MKIMMKNKQGVQTEIDPKNIIIREGITLEIFLNEFYKLRNEVHEDKEIRNRESKELRDRWNLIKK